MPGAEGVAVLGVLHCDLDGPPTSPYAPVRRVDLERQSVDAWLLGHVHRPSDLSGDRPLGYLGSLSALDPGEPGAHGPWRVEVDGPGRVRATQVPLAPMRYEQRALDVSEVGADGALAPEAALERAVLATLAEVAAECDAEDAQAKLVACRLTLKGRTAHHAELSPGPSTRASRRSPRATAPGGSTWRRSSTRRRRPSTSRPSPGDRAPPSSSPGAWSPWRPGATPRPTSSRQARERLQATASQPAFADLDADAPRRRRPPPPPPPRRPRGPRAPPRPEGGPVKLKGLAVRRLHDLGAFEVDDLAPGLNLLVGPNGSGKTSVMNAARAVLWGTPKLPHADLVTVWDDGRDTWRAVLVGGAAGWQRGGADVPPPEVPDAALAASWVVGLRELLTGGDTEDALLDRVRRQMAGGYDFAGLLDEYAGKRWPGRAEQKTLREKRDALRAIEGRRAELARSEDGLADLREQRLEALAARDEAERLGQALERARVAAELAAAEQRLTDFEAGVSVATADARDCLREWDEALAEARRAADAARHDLDRAAEAAGAAGIDEPVESGDLAAAREHAREVRERARDAAEARRAADAARAEVEAARQALAPDSTPDADGPAPDLTSTRCRPGPRTSSGPGRRWTRWRPASQSWPRSSRGSAPSPTPPRPRPSARRGPPRGGGGRRRRRPVARVAAWGSVGPDGGRGGARGAGDPLAPRPCRLGGRAAPGPLAVPRSDGGVAAAKARWPGGVDAPASWDPESVAATLDRVRARRAAADQARTPRGRPPAPRPGARPAPGRARRPRRPARRPPRGRHRRPAARRPAPRRPPPPPRRVARRGRGGGGEGRRGRRRRRPPRRGHRGPAPPPSTASAPARSPRRGRRRGSTPSTTRARPSTPPAATRPTPAGASTSRRPGPPTWRPGSRRSSTPPGSGTWAPTPPGRASTSSRGQRPAWEAAREEAGRLTHRAGELEAALADHPALLDLDRPALEARRADADARAGRLEELVAEISRTEAALEAERGSQAYEDALAEVAAAEQALADVRERRPPRRRRAPAPRGRPGHPRRAAAPGGVPAGPGALHPLHPGALRPRPRRGGHRAPRAARGGHRRPSGARGWPRRPLRRHPDAAAPGDPGGLRHRRGARPAPAALPRRVPHRHRSRALRGGGRRGPGAGRGRPAGLLPHLRSRRRGAVAAGVRAARCRRAAGGGSRPRRARSKAPSTPRTWPCRGARGPGPRRPDAAEYGRRLGVPRFDPFAGGDSVHLFHLLRDDLPLLRRLRSEGQVTPRAPAPGPRPRWRRAPRRRRAGAGRGPRRVARAFTDAWQVGRGRPVDQAALEASGAVSDAFVDRVTEVADELGGDAADLARRLGGPGQRARRASQGLPHQRPGAAGGLPPRRGLPRPRPRLTEAEILARCRDAVAEALDGGVLDGDESPVPSAPWRRDRRA